MSRRHSANQVLCVCVGHTIFFGESNGYDSHRQEEEAEKRRRPPSSADIFSSQSGYEIDQAPSLLRDIYTRMGEVWCG